MRSEVGLPHPPLSGQQRVERPYLITLGEYHSPTVIIKIIIQNIDIYIIYYLKLFSTWHDTLWKISSPLIPEQYFSAQIALKWFKEKMLVSGLTWCLEIFIVNKVYNGTLTQALMPFLSCVIFLRHHWGCITGYSPCSLALEPLVYAREHPNWEPMTYNFVFVLNSVWK